MTFSTPRRALAFEVDLGGFNNILMHFEIMVGLAWLTGRTLVIPPPTPLYLLGDEPLSLLDFFDLDVLKRHVDVQTAEEFAPEAATHEAFHRKMVERGHSMQWNAVEDVLLHPADAMTTRFELIPRLRGRRPVALLEPEQECEILYFPMNHEHRMFGVFETFFMFADPENERRLRTLMRDSIRYRPEILRLAEIAVESGPLAGTDYAAMHARRGDFQYEETRIGGVDIVRHTENLYSVGETLYLATDETEEEPLRALRERYRVVQFADLPPEVVSQTPYHWVGIVETLVCAAAPGRFAGTRLSTFSSRIATLRGHWQRAGGRYAELDTALYYTQPPIYGVKPEEMEPYAAPQQKHVDQHGETSTPWWESMTREPLWSRAYEATWADTL